MLLMTIFYSVVGSVIPRTSPIACFDREDALAKLEEFIALRGRDCIIALATDFEFPEGWSLVING